LIDVSLLAGGLMDGARRRLAGYARHSVRRRRHRPDDGPQGLAAKRRPRQGYTCIDRLSGVFSPIEIDGRWLVDGGLVNPVPVSLCRAMGADFIIAVNLGEDLLGRRLTRAAKDPAAHQDMQTVGNLLDAIRSVPASLRAQAPAIRLFGANGTTPGYFDVLANSINIMQDHITRSRLAGEPVMAA